jgi:hypothetical protein
MCSKGIVKWLFSSEKTQNSGLEYGLCLKAKFMTNVPDIKKFCVDLYETVHAICQSSHGVVTLGDLIRAVTSLKTHWKESTEGKQFVLLPEADQKKLGNDVTHLYEHLGSVLPSEILSCLIEIYTKAAWIQTGHLLTSFHTKELRSFGDDLQHLEEFSSLSTDMRAGVEVAQARFVTGEKKFVSELHIWLDEVFHSLEALMKKLPSTDKAVIGSALAKTKRKMNDEFAVQTPDLRRIENEISVLLHEISEHMHKRGGEKALREQEQERPLVGLVDFLKKTVEEITFFVRKGQVNL